jgi:hypothetical protein
MKKTRQEPVFLMEMPHSLRHMIMRRGLMLRSGRTRTLFVLGTGGQKSWLQATLIPSPAESTEESWDKAHELAGRFRCELLQDVFVEPASKAGRYQSLMQQPELEGAGVNPHIASPARMPYEPNRLAGVGPSPQPGMGSEFAIGPTRNPVGFGGGMSIPGLDLRLPSPVSYQKNGLPPDVEAFLSNVPSAKNAQLTCPLLYDLPGWSKLPESRQQMFETEAAQLIKQGLTLTPHMPHMQRSTLELIRVQPKVSKMLKQFLNEGSQTPVGE